MKQFTEDPDDYPHYYIGAMPIFEMDEHPEEYIIEIDETSTSSSIGESCIPIFGREQEFRDFRDKMQDLDLWDQDDFGVWPSYCY